MAGRVVSIIVGLGLIAGAAILYTEPFTPTLAATSIPNFTRSDAPPLAGVDDPRLARQPGEADLAYASRLNGEVSRAFAHCTPADSIAHSWLLSLLRTLGFSYLTDEGLLTSSRNLCGFCHQAAHIEAAALRRNGVEAEAHGLNGHVVVRATIDRGRYYLDPDYGVGPFSGDGEALGGQLEAAYTPLLGADAARVVSFYMSRDDNHPYYSDADLDTLERRQAVILVIQDLLLAVAVGIGIVFLWRGLRPRRGRTRRATGTPYSASASPANSAGSNP